MEEGKISETSTAETELLKELEKWKEKVEKAEKQKSEILLSKLGVDQKIRMMQNDLTDLEDQNNRRASEGMKTQENQKKQLSLIYEQNNELRKEILQLKLAIEKMKHEDFTQNVLVNSCFNELVCIWES